MGTWLLNVILPGTGLILARREWLGFLLAIVFGICGNVALAGWFIAPAAMPPWLAAIATVLALLSWAAAQIMLRRHFSRPKGPPSDADFSCQ
ncbi:MAG TPA: hypothetical protein VJZ71_16205 [Phycisphaerae bacterium]|nr:hypothetical protein [Phycisphaerae bacterium]